MSAPTLLTLPRELRDMIWDLAVSPRDLIVCSNHHNHPTCRLRDDNILRPGQSCSLSCYLKKTRDFYSFSAPTVNFFLICKQLHADLRPLIWKKTTIICSSLEWLRAFLRQLSLEDAALIRTLDLKFTINCTDLEPDVLGKSHIVAAKTKKPVIESVVSRLPQLRVLDLRVYLRMQDPYRKIFHPLDVYVTPSELMSLLGPFAGMATLRDVGVEIAFAGYNFVVQFTLRNGRLMGLIERDLRDMFEAGGRA